MMRLVPSAFHTNRLDLCSARTSATAELFLARIPSSFQKNSLFHDILILSAIQIYCHTCPEVAFRRIEVQLHVAQRIHHDVDALLLPQLRHDDTIPHLAKELACLSIGVRALHVLIEVRVWRLSNRRDTAAMRD